MLHRENMADSPKLPRGFAAMDPEERRKLARKGGRAVHRQGKSHEWSREEARVAGRKGGYAVQAKRRRQREK
jgi:uncharacterized protein